MSIWQDKPKIRKKKYKKCVGKISGSIKKKYNIIVNPFYESSKYITDIICECEECRKKECKCHKYLYRLKTKKDRLNIMSKIIKDTNLFKYNKKKILLLIERDKIKKDRLNRKIETDKLEKELKLKSECKKKLEDINKSTHKCMRCGNNEVYLSDHHIIPRDYGGRDNVENLIELCNSCHDYVEIKTDIYIKKYKRLDIDLLRSMIINDSFTV